MPTQVEFRPGQIVYHAESDRYATVVSTKSYFPRTPGKVGKVGMSTSSTSIYASPAHLKSAKKPLGLNMFGGIMDEENIISSTKVRTLISIKWLDGRWADAAWKSEAFIVKHPLEILAACADQ